MRCLHPRHQREGSDHRTVRRHRHVAYRSRWKGEGHRGTRRRSNHCLPHQRCNQELRERAHGKTPQEEVCPRRRLRNLRHVRRNPLPGQPGSRRSFRDPRLRLHQDPHLRQLPEGLPRRQGSRPPDQDPGARGNPYPPRCLRHRQGPRPGHRCGLLHPRMPSPAGVHLPPSEGSCRLRLQRRRPAPEGSRDRSHREMSL